MDLYEIARRFTIQARTVTINPGDTQQIVESNPNRYGFALVPAPTGALVPSIWFDNFRDQQFYVNDWDSRFEIRADKHPGLANLAWYWTSPVVTTWIVIEYLIERA